MLRPGTVLGRRRRREMSLPEVLLWRRLRRSGIRYRRQHPIGPCVAGFCNVTTRRVIEVDGAIHGAKGGPARDTERKGFLVDNGHRVIRVAAADGLRDADRVATSIVALVTTPLHRPADGPSPRSGEDFA